jgi:chromosomal replication initiation ATPase DnaA
MEHPGNMSVRYVTSESFVNDFINSLRDNGSRGSSSGTATTTCS